MTQRDQAGGNMTTVEFSKKQNLMFIVPEECGSGIQRIAKKVMQDI